MKKRSKKNFIGNSKNVIWALLIVAAAVTVYGIAQAATVSHTPSEITPQGAGSGFDSDYLQGLAATDLLSATGGGGAVACQVICNGACPSAPSGWTLTSNTGYSGGRDAMGAAAGRCAYTANAAYSNFYVATGTERMCCYFKS